MKTIVLVPCCGEKLAKPAAAKDLYQSQMFKACRKYAERNGDAWFILSALHRVIDPDTVTQPYDAKMPTTRNAKWLWARQATGQVMWRLEERIKEPCRIIHLGGEDYSLDGAEVADEGHTIEYPMKGMQIGQRLQWLKQQLATQPEPEEKQVNALEQATKGQVIGYIRVSTVDQNTERQLAGVQCDKIFEEKISGKSADRPQLVACLRYLREGDTLVVHSLDRLARNLLDLREMVETLTQTKGVNVKFMKENMVFSASATASPMQKLMLNMMGSFAEFEREIMLERQREGIAEAKARGAYAKNGRKKELQDDQVKELKRLVEEGVPKAELARQFGLSRMSVYRYLGVSH